jgi:hypothetical protein
MVDGAKIAGPAIQVIYHSHYALLFFCIVYSYRARSRHSGGSCPPVLFAVDFWGGMFSERTVPFLCRHIYCNQGAGNKKTTLSTHFSSIDLNHISDICTAGAFHIGTLNPKIFCWTPQVHLRKTADRHRKDYILPGNQGSGN